MSSVPTACGSCLHDVREHFPNYHGLGPMCVTCGDTNPHKPSRTPVPCARCKRVGERILGGICGSCGDDLRMDEQAERDEEVSRG